MQILLELLRKREQIKWSNVHHLVILDEKILYLTPEQEKDKSHFTDKEVSVTIHTGFFVLKLPIMTGSSFLARFSDGAGA